MNVLIYGDTETSPALRHEVPLAIGDAFLDLESDGRRAVLTNALEEGRIARVAPELERLLGEAFGRDELIAAGHPWWAIDQEVCVRSRRWRSARPPCLRTSRWPWPIGCARGASS